MVVPAEVVAAGDMVAEVVEVAVGRAQLGTEAREVVVQL